MGGGGRRVLEPTERESRLEGRAQEHWVSEHWRRWLSRNLPLGNEGGREFVTCVSPWLNLGPPTSRTIAARSKFAQASS